MAAVGKTYPAVEESVHGGVSFSHGIYVVVRRCYDLNGKRINGKQRGTVIVRYSDGTTRKVLK